MYNQINRYIRDGAMKEEKQKAIPWGQLNRDKKIVAVQVQCAASDL